MKYLASLLLLSILFTSCKNHDKELKSLLSKGDTLKIEYAKGFEVVSYEGFKLMTVKSPWPDAEKDFIYALVNECNTLPEGLEYDQKVNLPIEQLVVTSTTHIPSLEALGEEHALVGFPNLDYISSKKTRQLINNNKVKELGANESINTEILLELQPDVVIGFAIDNENKTFNIIQKNGTPVIFNADWLETHPLGKAEWLKFFGVLFNKTDEATQLFNEIATSYEETKKLAKSVNKKPTVLCGAMYKDVWYLPYGNSWQAKFISDANAKYVYGYTNGKGSISLAFEKVLDKAENSEYWLAPGSFSSYDAMLEASSHYNQFKAFQDNTIFSFASTTGETGGVLYYELGPNRPDLVLKDMVSILHPELLKDYTPTFFKPLN